MRSGGVNETARAQASGEGDGPVEIRRLSYADLPNVISIERRSFPSPWSLAMFLSELSRADSVCLAATAGEQLVGYLICSRYDRVWHLNNVAVAPTSRGRGIGTRLVESMFGAVGERLPFTLEVRPSNLPAITVYERLGFRSAGLRPGYYPDNKEDAMIMWRQGSPDQEVPGKVHV